MELKEQPQEKVRQLEESILEEAKAAAALKEEEAQKLHSQAMEKAENEILREIYGKIQAQVAQIEAASTKETVNFELAQKRELLEMRRQLQEQVFAAVRERLVRFTKTEEYAAYLKDTCGRLAQQYDDEASVLAVRPQDAALVQGLLGLFHRVRQVRQDAAISLGGIRLENAAKNYLVDETLDFSLQEQRDWFYTHSGLTMED